MFSDMLDEIRQNRFWLVMIVIVIALAVVYFVYVNGQKSAFRQGKDDFLKNSLTNYFCSEHSELTFYEAGACPECQAPLEMSNPVVAYKTEDKYICPIHKDIPPQKSPGNCPKCGIVLIKEDPAKDYIEKTSAYVKALAAEKDKIISDYQKGDDILEKWFPDLKLGTDSLPDATSFRTRYEDGITALEGRFISGKVQTGSSIAEKAGITYTQALPKPAANIYDKKENLKLIQKQFNVLEKVVNAMFTKNQDGVDEPLIAQFERMVFDTTGDYSKMLDMYWGKTPAVARPGKPLFTEGSLVNFAFAVKMRYEDIPLMTSNLLKVDDNYTPYLQITGIKVRKLETLPDAKMETVSQEDYDGGRYRPSEFYLPAYVMVTITACVYDFNFTPQQ